MITLKTVWQLISRLLFSIPSARVRSGADQWLLQECAGLFTNLSESPRDTLIQYASDQDRPHLDDSDNDGEEGDDEVVEFNPGVMACYLHIRQSGRADYCDATGTNSV